ncbi:MAG: hypothetical protein ACRC6U_10505 [Fusobacteriaceae bacterium]
MVHFNSTRYPNKKETGFLRMLFISLLILTLILILYSAIIYSKQNDIIEPGSFKFFFKRFIRKTALLFNLKV